jgi:hypothetical protein
MKCITKYVALDVHQATTVASVRGEGGRVLAHAILPTEEPAVVEFFRGMRGAVHVAFEEGTQAQWLHDLLTPLVDRVVVCDRRGEKRLGNKADQPDADELSELLRRGALRAVYHGSSHRATLRELARSYQNLVEDSTRVMLRLKALFRARGIKAPGKRLYHPGERGEWLAKLPERGVRFRAEALYAELDVLRELRPKAKAAMIAEARRDPAWVVLQTIPSCAQRRAQGCRHCCLRLARAAAGLLRRQNRERRPRRASATDADTQDHRDRAAPMEDRREIRSDEVDDASSIESGRTSRRRRSSYPAKAPSSGTVVQGAVSTGSLARPAVSRGTRLTLGPLAEPKEASGRPSAESQIEPWFAV